MKHPGRILSQRASDALAGKPYVLSDWYSPDEWQAAEDDLAAGETAQFEAMLLHDAAAYEAERVAQHDPRYRDGHWSLSDWIDFTGRDLDDFTPRVAWGMAK